MTILPKHKTGTSTPGPLTFKPQFNLNAVLGFTAVFGSALFFYLSTVIIKWSKMSGESIDPSFFVFSRFFLGFLSVTAVMGVRKKRISIKNKHYLVGRTLANCVAVYCFFKGVALTSVGQANILNMTYPLFITVFSWFLFREQRDVAAVAIVITACAGVWLILSPGTLAFQTHSLWALASGISAAVGIIYLNLSRQVHDTHTTLFFMFSLGSLIILVLFYDRIYLPTFDEFQYLFWCSASAIFGQYLLTMGFKYVTATEGGIISSTRILLAAVLGPFIAMDPVLPFSGWIGACLIFFANVCLTIRTARK